MEQPPIGKIIEFRVWPTVGDLAYYSDKELIAFVTKVRSEKAEAEVVFELAAQMHLEIEDEYEVLSAEDKSNAIHEVFARMIRLVDGEEGVQELINQIKGSIDPQSITGHPVAKSLKELDLLISASRYARANLKAKVKNQDATATDLRYAIQGFFAAEERWRAARAAAGGKNYAKSRRKPLNFSMQSLRNANPVVNLLSGLE